MPRSEDLTPGGPDATGSPHGSQSGPAPAPEAFDAPDSSGSDGGKQGVPQESTLTGTIPATPPLAPDFGNGRTRPHDPASAPAGHAGPRGFSAHPGEAAGSAAAYEAEERRQEAFDVAWRFLGHRDRTEAEVRRNFTRKRVDPALVEQVVAALLEGGYVDDAAFARRFVEDRRNLDGWGSERIARRLNELGVDRAEIRAALAATADADEEGGHDELEAACDLLARRFPVPPETPRDLERALGFLVRKGYDLELAHDALRKHAGATIEG